MIIKKFVGKTEEEATEAARAELGEGVVIMNVKSLKGKGFFAFFRRPQVEITAAVEEVNDSNVSNVRPVKLPPYRQGSRATSRPMDEFKGPVKGEEPSGALGQEGKKSSEDISEDSIEQKLDSIHSILERQMRRDESKEEAVHEPAAVKADKGAPSEMERFRELIRGTLIENEVDEKYVRELSDEVEKLMKPGTSLDYLLSNIYQRMVLKFGQVHPIEKTNDEVQAVIFLGPTGVGKTTTIAKIASRLCVQNKKRVALITTDTYRVKAAEQLRTYADILNIPFRIVYQQEDMKGALQEFMNFDFVLIDTAGHSPKNEEQLSAQAQYIGVVQDSMRVELYLVMSATTKYRDLIGISDAYAKFGAYHIIFTKLDETSAFGNMLNIKLYTGAALSYVTNGQDVPDDIEVFRAQKTVRILLGGKAEDDSTEEAEDTSVTEDRAAENSENTVRAAASVG